jgi:DNA invertase Pin-like site-specific DNA recombinase
MTIYGYARVSTDGQTLMLRSPHSRADIQILPQVSITSL